MLLQLLHCMKSKLIFVKFNNYYKPLLSLLKTYKLDGIDIDIEEKVPLSTPLRLLRRLHTDMGPLFLKTMAPLSTAMSEDDILLSGFSYHALDTLAITSSSFNPDEEEPSELISWFNIQCHGPCSRSPSRYKSIIASGFTPERVVLGVTTSAAGHANGFTTLKILTGTVRA